MTTEISFIDSYKEWISQNNSFVDFFTVNGEEQARVIFIGSQAYSKNGDGKKPTVSEGMGYALLLALAANDQQNFDRFLRYILGTSNNYGCSSYGNGVCYASAPYMMPWIVNEEGKPFWYAPFPGSISYYSNGSATDADIQIAWALYLATLKLSQNGWSKTTFQTINGTWTYEEIFQEMAKEIRLADIDFNTLRYLPGNQWAAAGKKVLYPGYLTPEAFTALDSIAPPDVSSTCPTLISHIPANSLKLIFKNNVAKSVSIDYLGGNGTVTVDANFVPKEGNPNGYVVAGVTTAEALFTSPNEYYANATIEATYYDENGTATMKSHYYIEYNNSLWSVTDKGSTKESSFCSTPTINEVFVCLTAPDINKIDFPFSTVMTNSLQAIQEFQTQYGTGLMPNVIHYDETGYDLWSESFAYDACRFPLWVAQSLQKNSNNSSLSTSLQKLLNSLPSFVSQGSLPSGGIDAITQQAVGNWDVASVALNGPILPGAKEMEDQTLFDSLKDGVYTYDITTKQPQITDPEGDSGPYFNAVMVLLTRVILEGLL